MNDITKTIVEKIYTISLIEKSQLRCIHRRYYNQCDDLDWHAWCTSEAKWHIGWCSIEFEPRFHLNRCRKDIYDFLD